MKYAVICMEEGKWVNATSKLFATKAEAQAYADTINRFRFPRVVQRHEPDEMLGYSQRLDLMLKKEYHIRRGVLLLDHEGNPSREVLGTFEGFDLVARMQRAYEKIAVLNRAIENLREILTGDENE